MVNPYNAVMNHNLTEIQFLIRKIFIVASWMERQIMKACEVCIFIYAYKEDG